MSSTILNFLHHFNCTFWFCITSRGDHCLRFC